MTGVGETLLPLALPIMPCVMVNPRVPVATSDVFKALGLRNGELLVGATDVFEAAGWPEAGASLEDWVEALAAGTNDLEAPAMRIQPVIGEVHRGAQRHQRRLAGADVGIGRDLLCDLREHRRGRPRRGETPARSPRMVGACGNAELTGSGPPRQRERNSEAGDENPGALSQTPDQVRPAHERCAAPLRPMATTMTSANVLSVTEIRPERHELERGMAAAGSRNCGMNARKNAAVLGFKRFDQDAFSKGPRCSDGADRFAAAKCPLRGRF